MNRIYGLTLRGIDALPVEVEVCVTGGLFSISIVGLADTAVKEARERVRIALGTLGIKLKGHIAVNLAPADLPKEGALLDLPMAVGIAREAVLYQRTSVGFSWESWLWTGVCARLKGECPQPSFPARWAFPFSSPEGMPRKRLWSKGLKSTVVQTLRSCFHI